MVTSVDFLKKIPYFASLEPSDLENIKSLISEKRFHRNEIIFLEGYPSPGIHFVISGRVKIFKTSVEGKEQVLAVMEPFDSFNDVPLFDGGPNPACAQAIEPSVIYIVRKENMLSIIRDYPSVALAVLRVFAERLRHLTLLVEDLSFRRVTSRLAKILLQYAEGYEESGARATGVTLQGPKRALGLKQRITQQELAAMVGTAREMVSRSLKTLEEEGAIKMERHKILIHNPQLLREISYRS
jgi:CRP/FNR family transcriptional regulator